MRSDYFNFLIISPKIFTIYRLKKIFIQNSQSIYLINVPESKPELSLAELARINIFIHPR